LLLTSSAGAATTYTFQTLNNPGDPNFNQLLGINNAGTIGGYFGDGSVIPNNGYTLKPPAGYAAENFPGSVQTQVVAINNAATPVTGGFYIDGAGNNIGFVKIGNSFTSVSDPSTPTTGVTTNQILGLNDNNQAVGFYVDAAGNAHGFLYNTLTKSFTPINLPGSFNAVSVTAAGINNAGQIDGFYTDSGGATHAFIENGINFTSIDDPSVGATNTMFFGLNNDGSAVGTFTDGSGVSEGVVYDFLTKTFESVNDPNNSPNAAFNVTGTLINGINDQGDLVGFYSDGTNVDGFEATPVPEPAALSLMGLGAVAAGLISRRKSRKS